MGVGYLVCSFDLLNIEHLDLIAQAHSHCRRLIVGVMSDEQVTELTGRPPVVPLAERVALVEHVRGVDQAVVHESVDFHRLRPDVVFVGPEAQSQMMDAVRLATTRQSASVELQAALRPVVQAVA